MATRTLRSLDRIALIGGRHLRIPPGGWTAESFAQHGARMIQTMQRAAKYTQRRMMPEVARTMKRIMESQLHRIISRVEQSRQHHRLGFRSPRYLMDAEQIAIARKAADESTFLFSFPQEEELWKEAIDYVMKTSGVEVVTAMTPPIQSAMAQGYQQSAILLAEQADAQIAGAIARQARKMATEITSINDTTRENILNALKTAVEEQKTVVETAAYIEERVGGIIGNRALTIARTELNRAWTEGAAISFKESGAVTHVSVIGCESREDSSPQYDGESTCNFPDLPIGELDAFLAVGFHPNHTGTLVPSGFASDGGADENE